jgi:hypothetical protein
LKQGEEVPKPQIVANVEKKVSTITAPMTLPPSEWLGKLTEKLQLKESPKVLPQPTYFQNQLLPQFHLPQVNGGHFQPPMFFNGNNVS